MLLTVGPVGLIGLSFVTAAPERGEWDGVWSKLGTPLFEARAPRLSEIPSEAFSRAAVRVQSRFPAAWDVVERYPFVVTGNVTVDELERAVNEVVLPTYHALKVDYFDHPPSEPIAILLLADDQSYADALGRMGHAGRNEYAGIYSRRDRQLLINLSSGDGTIAHELTHALAHADFLRMPQWFDEGLAALHEESVFTADGRHLIGQPNWRDALLRDALAQPRPPKLESLITGSFGRGRATVDCALARALCRYLQSRQLLTQFYRKCRARVHEDPTGGLALLEVTGFESLDELDTRFRTWFSSQPR